MGQYFSWIQVFYVFFGNSHSQKEKSPFSTCGNIQYSENYSESKSNSRWYVPSLALPSHINDNKFIENIKRWPDKTDQ